MVLAWEDRHPPLITAGTVQRGSTDLHRNKKKKNLSVNEPQRKIHNRRKAMCGASKVAQWTEVSTNKTGPGSHRAQEKTESSKLVL